MNNLKQTVIMFIIIQLQALACLWVIKHKLIDTGLLHWNTPVGYVVLILPIVMTVYAWIMLLVSYLTTKYGQYCEYLRVTENEGQWSAKIVHYLDKHKGCTEM